MSEHCSKCHACLHPDLISELSSRTNKVLSSIEWLLIISKNSHMSYRHTISTYRIDTPPFTPPYVNGKTTPTFSFDILFLLIESTYCLLLSRRSIERLTLHTHLKYYFYLSNRYTHYTAFYSPVGQIIWHTISRIYISYFSFFKIIILMSLTEKVMFYLLEQVVSIPVFSSSYCKWFSLLCDVLFSLFLSVASCM